MTTCSDKAESGNWRKGQTYEMQNWCSILEKLRREEQVVVTCECTCKPDVELKLPEKVTSHGKTDAVHWVTEQIWE